MLQTGVSGEIAQQVFGPVDVVVRGGLQRLEYRERAGAPAPSRQFDGLTCGTAVTYGF